MVEHAKRYCAINLFTYIAKLVLRVAWLFVLKRIRPVVLCAPVHNSTKLKQPVYLATAKVVEVIRELNRCSKCIIMCAGLGRDFAESQQCTLPCYSLTLLNCPRGYLAHQAETILLNFCLSAACLAAWHQLGCISRNSLFTVLPQVVFWSSSFTFSFGCPPQSCFGYNRQPFVKRGWYVSIFCWRASHLC